MYNARSRELYGPEYRFGGIVALSCWLPIALSLVRISLNLKKKLFLMFQSVKVNGFNVLINSNIRIISTYIPTMYEYCKSGQNEILLKITKFVCRQFRITTPYLLVMEYS